MVQVLEEPTRECGLRNGPNRRADLRMKSMHENPGLGSNRFGARRAPGPRWRWPTGKACLTF